MLEADHLWGRNFRAVQRYTRRDMPSKRAATIMAKDETGARIIGMTINKAHMEIARVTAVNFLMPSLNSSP